MTIQVSKNGKGATAKVELRFWQDGEGRIGLNVDGNLSYVKEGRSPHLYKVLKTLLAANVGVMS
jgi:hypothetical protein